MNVETIRYYERRGLLREPPRTHAGYRQYSGADLWRLQFIARAKQMGFTLAEIATLVGDRRRRFGARHRGHGPGQGAGDGRGPEAPGRQSLPARAAHRRVSGPRQ